MASVLGDSKGCGRFRVGEVPLYIIGTQEVQGEAHGSARAYRGTSLIRNTHPPRTTIGP